MKLNSLHKAVFAIMGAAVAGNALAAWPTLPADVIYLSGATASSNNLREVIANDPTLPSTAPTQLCDKTADITIVRGGSMGFAINCNVKDTAFDDPTTAAIEPAPAGWGVNRQVEFVKRERGGSAFGVSPVSLATSIAHLNFRELAQPAAQDAGYPLATGLGGNYNVYTVAPTGLGANTDSLTACSDISISDGWNCAISSAGTSDVEPELLGVATGLTKKSISGLIFGIPVTTKLRDQLQVAQFGASSACIGDETEACMPSLSKQEVASLLAGKVQTWDKFTVNGVALTAVAGGTAPSPTTVHVCRRVSSSGTQTMTQAKFLGTGCGATGIAPAPQTTSGLSKPQVLENSGAGDVDTCLNTKNGAGIWAVGVQSTEKNLPVGGVYPLGYRFVKIDGAAPTRANVIAGSYFDWSEDSMQWLGSTDALKANLFTTIASRSGDPELFPTYTFTWGVAGNVALATNGYPVTDARVSPYSHTNGSATASVCRTPTIVNLNSAGMDQGNGENSGNP